MGNGTRSAPGAAASPARAASVSSYPLLKAGIPPDEAPHSRATPSRRKSLFIQSSEEPFGPQLTLFQQNRPTFPPHLLSSSPEHPLHPRDARSVSTALPVSLHPGTQPGDRKGQNQSVISSENGNAHPKLSPRSHPPAAPGCLSRGDTAFLWSSPSPGDAQPPLRSRHCCSPWKGPGPKANEKL